MSKLKSMLSMEMVDAMAAHYEERYGVFPNDKSMTPDPEWKRKKCKSCKSFNKILGRNSCCSNPNQQACGSYKKRKK